MMHITNADPGAFGMNWDSDIGGFITTAPCSYQVGDTIKTLEQVNGVATGRYTLATVTSITPISGMFVSVAQTIFQRAVQ